MPLTLGYGPLLMALMRPYLKIPGDSTDLNEISREFKNIYTTIPKDSYRHLNTFKTCSTCFTHTKIKGMYRHSHTPLPGADHRPIAPSPLASPPPPLSSPPPSPHSQVYRVSPHTFSFSRVHQHQIKANSKPIPEKQSHPIIPNVSWRVIKTFDLDQEVSGCGNMFVQNSTTSISGWGRKPLGRYPWMAPPPDVMITPCRAS